MDNFYRRIKEIEVLDGDTFRGVIELGFGVKLSSSGKGKKPTFRLLGIDTPETTRRGSWDENLTERQIRDCIFIGQVARSRVAVLLEQADEVYVHSPGWQVDSLGRILAHVYAVIDHKNGRSTINVSEHLLNEGLAIKFDKNKRPADFTVLLKGFDNR